MFARGAIRDRIGREALTCCAELLSQRSQPVVPPFELRGLRFINNEAIPIISFKGIIVHFGIPWIRNILSLAE